MVNNPFFGLLILLNDRKSKGSRIQLPLIGDMGSPWQGRSSIPIPNTSCGFCATYPFPHQPFWDTSGGSPVQGGAEWDHGGERNAGRGARPERCAECAAPPCLAAEADAARSI